jgi:hypothetical protein
MGRVYCMRRENSQNAVILVASLGFATPVHPNAMHGAIFHVKR